MSYGKLTLHIEEILRERGISKTKVCKELDIPRTNFNKYCRNEFQRLDELLLCKLCWYLNIDIGQLVTYERPEEEQKE